METIVDGLKVAGSYVFLAAVYYVLVAYPAIKYLRRKKEKR